MEFSINTNSESHSLKHAILIYQSDHHNGTHYLTKNEVTEINGKSVIGAGTMLTADALKQVANSLKTRQKKQENLAFLDTSVIAKSDKTIIWWVPAGKQKIFFNTKTEGLEKVAAVVDQPALVFFYSKKTWKVFALASNKRPNENTPLLVSPYLNVNDQHSICIGSTVMPKGLDHQLLTQAFFASAFTHSNYRSRPIKYDGDREQLWIDLINGKLTQFPRKCLPKCRLTVGDLIAEGSRRESISY
ncbi:PRTRC system protein B [Undibacterium oligocarboniphilum]|uniref:PRTRC system protein B n=1 Tax=Undibacterium oligocarboniphilum TaxID=666702 RepID=A0A850QFY9_9BURK|nr:PRTRC system protein B [Undibacterium oligocarboniphilum]MBC3871776.1 PRTRC system protein B [Undibacterium oligocarboniphilum]NVO79412.1 PRTRC system protein B [Undibacterium oligocarboniphilum]